MIMIAGRIYLRALPRSSQDGVANPATVYGSMNLAFSSAVHMNTGMGCASVLNTHLSSGTSSSPEKRRYRYFNLLRAKAFSKPSSRTSNQQDSRLGSEVTGEK